MSQVLKEGEDFTYDDQGRMVLTRQYHLKRGYCCQSGCRHCPYGYHDKVDPNYPSELQNPWESDEQAPDDEEYDD